MQDSLFAYSEEEEEGKVAAKAKRRPASKRKMPKVQLGKSPRKRGKVANFCFIFRFSGFMVLLSGQFDVRFFSIFLLKDSTGRREY